MSHRDRTHKERAEDVLGPEGFTLTQDQTDLAGIPDRVELTTADDLLARITWQKVAPELDLNFPDAGRLPGGTPFRYQVTGYGGVSALVMHGDEAVILTIVPSHKAIASGKSDKVMPEGKVAAMAQRLLEG